MASMAAAVCKELWGGAWGGAWGGVWGGVWGGLWVGLGLGGVGWGGVGWGCSANYKRPSHLLQPCATHLLFDPVHLIQD